MKEEMQIHVGDRSMNLGSIYNQNNTTFRLWAPNAENVHLCLYKDGHSASLLERSAMLLKREDDIWESVKNPVIFTVCIIPMRCNGKGRPSNR